MVKFHFEDDIVHSFEYVCRESILVLVFIVVLTIILLDEITSAIVCYA